MTGRSELPRAMTRLAACLPDQAPKKKADKRIIAGLLGQASENSCPQAVPARNTFCRGARCCNALGFAAKEVHVEGKGSTSTL